MNWDELFPGQTPEQVQAKLAEDAQKLTDAEAKVEEWKGHARTWEDRSKENKQKVDDAIKKLTTMKGKVSKALKQLKTARSQLTAKLKETEHLLANYPPEPPPGMPTQEELKA